MCAFENFFLLIKDNERIEGENDGTFKQGISRGKLHFTLFLVFVLYKLPSGSDSF
jgi:hypothetical protein